uniref:Facilitated trehalose transporter Tret1-2 homolog n=1 Tax=Cacopsylla melanoneura TaxID=428564 RepID=A0A8D8WCJ4_9HEMI
MYVARFFSGISVGCIFMVTPMYIAEIADTRVRSALGSLFTLFLIFGYLVEYSIGPYFSSTVLVLVSFISPITCLTIFCTVLPESPLYLMGKGEREAATSALQWLRRREDVSDEIKEIEVSLEESRTTDLVSWSQLLTTRGHLKCLYYVITLILFQQLSGVTVILFYSEPILKMTSSDLSPAVGTILLAVVYMLASFWAPGLTAKFGIKRLLVLSSIGCCFFLVSAQVPGLSWVSFTPPLSKPNHPLSLLRSVGCSCSSCPNYFPRFPSLLDPPFVLPSSPRSALYAPCIL